MVDFDGRELPTGQDGRLLVRACSNFGGYLHRPQWNNTDAQGWFDTGDLATLDAKGYIRISGRSKDVIIRGGENIPVVEIENLLYRHPAVLQLDGLGELLGDGTSLGRRAAARVAQWLAGSGRQPQTIALDTRRSGHASVGIDAVRWSG